MRIGPLIGASILAVTIGAARPAFPAEKDVTQSFHECKTTDEFINFSQNYIQALYRFGLNDRAYKQQVFYFFKDAKPYKYTDLRALTFRQAGSTLMTIWVPTAGTCVLLYGDQISTDGQGAALFGLPGSFSAETPAGDLLSSLKQRFPDKQ